MRSLYRFLVFLVALVLTPQVAFSVFVGPPSNSAGIVERQIEKEYDGKKVDAEREVPLLEIDIPEEQLDIGSDGVAFINSILVEGNSTLSNKEIQKIVAPYQGRDLSMIEIKELCVKLQQAYVQQGFFLARVYPPVQEITNGTLSLEVMEGKLGEITIQGEKYYKEKFIRKYFAKFQGKAINYDELLRSLFLLNENSDLQVGAVFKKGSEVGTADLIVQVSDKRPCHLYVDENNYGANNTTVWRTGGKFDYGNLFTNGDMISVTQVIGNPANNLIYTNASYEIPLNAWGTSLEMEYVYSSFHVSQLEFLNLRGRTQIGSVQVTQALNRNRKLSTDVYLSFDYKQIVNYQENTKSSYDKLRVLTAGFDFDYTDACKGRNIGDVYYTLGIPNFLGGLKPVDSIASREGSGGSFSILNVDYTRMQTLPLSCFLMLHFSGQATPYKLPLSQQIYIGGVDTVRGFSMASALGDDGYYANFELRTPIPGLVHQKFPGSKREWKDWVQLVGFVDQGGVLLNGGGENQQHHISMTGAGVGIRIYGPYRFNVSFDIGFPLTNTEKTHSPVYYFKAAIQPF
ncbi:MAG: ShlB/FhaC/HecB family hemolysin secretion/activation protein [Chlamydiae bacterium]|nr:ShlB/FhaC/HecB family hemolysin secretion/activation protein [Chlamydiota bacterium]